MRMTCPECERLLDEVIAANKRYGALVLQTSKASNRQSTEQYRSLRSQLELAGIDVNRARAQYFHYRQESG